MKNVLRKKLRLLQAAIVIAVLLVANLSVLPKAFASNLTQSSLLEIGTTGNANPMIASDAQEVAIGFKTVASGATTIAVNFGSGTFVTAGGSVASSGQTASSTGCATYFPGFTPAPGTLTAATATNTVTISGVTSLAATTTYCAILTLATAITNPSTATVYTATLTVGSDSQIDAFDVLSSGANAYSITGTISPTFTMSLSGGGTDSFPSALSSTTLTASTGITATINTNGLSGWYLYAEDTNAGLHSTLASTTIPSVLSGGGNVNMGSGGDQGSADYALGVTTDYATNYQYTSGTHNYGGSISNSAFTEIATNNAPANGVTTVLHELADISPTTPPATDYTDTITVIGTGSF